LHHKSTIFHNLTATFNFNCFSNHTNFINEIITGKTFPYYSKKYLLQSNTKSAMPSLPSRTTTFSRSQDGAIAQNHQTQAQTNKS
jgi:hypothetical protein